MTDNDNRREQSIETLQDFPDVIAGLVLQLDDDDLYSEYLPGEWTVNQIVNHLVDAHQQAFFRCKLILTAETPNLQVWRQDEFAKTPEYDLIPIDDAVETLSLLHERWVLLLGELEEAHWQRTGIHPVRGEMTLDQLVEMYAGHCSIHIDQIKKTLAARQP